jgi:chromosome partitioning protein
VIKIGVLNSKGGVGKTLIATILAVRAARDFTRVAVLDIDPQQSATRWWIDRGSTSNPSVIVGDISPKDSLDSLAAGGWQFVLLDGLPSNLLLAEDAVKSVDFVLIPMKAASFDLTASEDTIALCRKHRRDFMVVINEVTPNHDKRADEMRRVLELLRVPVADTMIARRVPYVDAANVGKSAAEIASGRAAEQEIDALYENLMVKVRSAAASRERAHV